MPYLPALVLFAQLAATAPTPDSVYATPALRALVGSAAAANRVPPSLAGYRASVESELAFVLRDSLGRERVSQVEQLASRVTWRATPGGDDYTTHVVGYRSHSIGAPYSALNVVRGFTVPVLYGERVMLGLDMNDSARLERADRRHAERERQGKVPAASGDTIHGVHPLAHDRERYYRFTGGDTVATLRGGARTIYLVRVHVVPDAAGATRRLALFEGELDLDAERAQVVRMRGQFLVAGKKRQLPLVSRVLLTASGLVGAAFVELVNAEIGGRYWLPARQRVDFQASFAGMGNSRSIFRVVSRFGDYAVDTTAAPVTEVASAVETRAPASWVRRMLDRHRSRTTYAGGDSLSRYGGWREEPGEATASVSADDFDDLAPDVWRPTGRPSIGFRPTKMEEVFRYDRVEGAYVGLASSVRFRDAAPGVTARAWGGVATAEHVLRGGLTASRQHGHWSAGVRAERALESTDDFVGPFEGGSSIAALLGADNDDWVDRRIATAVLTRTLGPDRDAIATLQVGYGDDRTVRRNVARAPLTARRFRANAWAMPGGYLRSDVTVEYHPNVSGVFLAPGVGARVHYERGDGTLAWQRVELGIAARRIWGDVTAAASADGGMVVGGRLPPQTLFELGGGELLPGYAPKAFAGDRAALFRAGASYGFRALREPWRAFGFTFPGPAPRIGVSMHGGWSELSSEAARLAAASLEPPPILRCDEIGFPCSPIAHATNGVRGTASVGLSIFSGFLSAGVGRAMERDGKWKLVAGVGREM